jgi:hypothetical protein
MLSPQEITKAFVKLGIETEEKRDLLVPKDFGIEPKPAAVRDIHITDNTSSQESEDANLG